MNKYLIVCILALAFILRIVGLANYPVGFTQDEAGLGYDAYSLLLTGRDQWGKSLPLVLRSFGDFKMPLYSYLTIPSIAFLGLNEFSVRLPNAILGSLAVVVTYLMVSEMTKRKAFGLWAALFLAISPWHIGLSRGAFEANLTSFFVPLGVWAFIKGLQRPRLMVLSAFAFGLNLFSYHSARLFTPILIAILIYGYREHFVPIGGKRILEILTKFKLALLVFGIFFLAAVFTMFTGGAKRGLDITILSPTDRWAAVADKRYEAVQKGLPDFLARAYSNKVNYVLTTFGKNYLSYFSSAFLFSEGPGEWSYGMIPGRGVLYFYEIIFILVALFAFIKKAGFNKIEIILLWILVAPIPAALTKGPGFAANRVAVMLPAITILSAWGVVYLLEVVRKKYSQKAAVMLTGIIFAISAVSLAGFLAEYRYLVPQRASKAMQYGMREMAGIIYSIEGSYDEVVLSRTLSVPNIWVQFYQKTDPALVQRASRSWLRYEAQGVKYLDQISGYSLAKHTFGDIVLEELKGRNVLAVGRTWEFPSNVKPLATIQYLDGEPAFILVDANEL